MKRIFSSSPECGDYARFPQFVHEQREHNGAMIEEVRQLSPDEIIERSSSGSPVDISDNSGIIVPSSDYRDNFATIDALEAEIDKVEPKTK